MHSAIKERVVETMAVCSKMLKQTQETLVKAHALLVRRLAYQLLSRLPDSVQLDDLIQSGMVGLLEAVRNYDASKGASFETYAGIRIRGHMIDEIRRNGWLPRSVYRNARTISEAVKKVENRLGRKSKDCEVAAEMEMNLTQYYDFLQDSTGSQWCGFDDLGVSDDQLKGEGEGMAEPQAKVMREDLTSHLTQVIDGLPRNERLVVFLYYQRDLNLKEIGEVLNVSESRVSQIHTQATLKIRALIAEQFN